MLRYENYVLYAKQNFKSVIFLKRPIYNIEPYIDNLAKLDFDEFVKNKKLAPNYYQKEFEIGLKSFLNTEKEICVLQSGTAAIHLALLLSDVRENDVVLCSSATFIASVNPILYAGAIPFFVDVEMKTGNMNPEYLENAIKKCLAKNQTPKAIIVTHSYGVPAQIDRLKEIKDKYNLVLIEDAAEALGAKYDDQYCGTLADYGIFSFNTNKLNTTLGGGALVVKNKNKKDRALFLASQAKLSGVDFVHDTIGYNYRMNDLAAYVGVAQLKHLEQELEKKQKIFNWYVSTLKEIEGVRLLFQMDTTRYNQNHWMNCLYFNNEQLKLKVLNSLLKEGIEVRGFWTPMHHQIFLKKFDYEGNKESESLYKNALCLPSSVNLELKIVEKIALIIRRLAT